MVRHYLVVTSFVFDPYGYGVIYINCSILISVHILHVQVFCLAFIIPLRRVCQRIHPFLVALVTSPTDRWRCLAMLMCASIDRCLVFECTKAVDTALLRTTLYIVASRHA